MESKVRTCMHECILQEGDYFRDQREWISLRSKIKSLNRKEISKTKHPKVFNVRGEKGPDF